MSGDEKHRISITLKGGRAEGSVQDVPPGCTHVDIPFYAKPPNSGLELDIYNALTGEYERTWVAG